MIIFISGGNFKAILTAKYEHNSNRTTNCDYTHITETCVNYRDKLATKKRNRKLMNTAGKAKKDV